MANDPLEGFHEVNLASPTSPDLLAVYEPHTHTHTHTIKQSAIKRKKDGISIMYLNLKMLMVI